MLAAQQRPGCLSDLGSDSKLILTQVAQPKQSADHKHLCPVMIDEQSKKPRKQSESLSRYGPTETTDAGSDPNVELQLQ